MGWSGLDQTNGLLKGLWAEVIHDISESDHLIANAKCSSFIFSWKHADKKVLQDEKQSARLSLCTEWATLESHLDP